MHRSLRLVCVVLLLLGFSGCNMHQGADVQPLPLPVLPEVHVAGLPDGVGAPRLVVDRTHLAIDPVPMLQAWRRQAPTEVPGALDDPRLKLTFRAEPSMPLAKLDLHEALLVERLRRLRDHEAAMHKAFALGTARALDVAIAGDVSSEVAIGLLMTARSAGFDRLRLLVHVGGRLAAVPIFTPSLRSGFGSPPAKAPHCASARLSVTRAGVAVHLLRTVVYKCGPNLTLIANHRLGLSVLDAIRKTGGPGLLGHAIGAKSLRKTSSTPKPKTEPTGPAWDERTIVVDRQTCPTFPFHDAPAFEPLLGELMERVGHATGGLCCLGTVAAAPDLPFATFARVLAAVPGHGGITAASPAIRSTRDDEALACKEPFVLPPAHPRP